MAEHAATTPAAPLPDLSLTYGAFEIGILMVMLCVVVAGLIAF